MPNIGALLREEISRLSRREVRRHIETTKRATAQHRRHIAQLKRQVSKLERKVSLLEGRVLDIPDGTPGTSSATRVRFVATGLRSQRERLGLSAADYGRLVGVSAQSVYNWEREQAKPRKEQIATLAALRQMGKREAQIRLERLKGKRATTRDKS